MTLCVIHNNYCVSVYVLYYDNNYAVKIQCSYVDVIILSVGTQLVLMTLVPAGQESF